MTIRELVVETAGSEDEEAMVPLSGAVNVDQRGFRLRGRRLAEIGSWAVTSSAMDAGSSCLRYPLESCWQLDVFRFDRGARLEKQL